MHISLYFSSTLTVLYSFAASFIISSNRVYITCHLSLLSLCILYRTNGKSGHKVQLRCSIIEMLCLCCRGGHSCSIEEWQIFRCDVDSVLIQAVFGCFLFSFYVCHSFICIVSALALAHLLLPQTEVCNNDSNKSNMTSP